MRCDGLALPLHRPADAPFRQNRGPWLKVATALLRAFLLYEPARCAPHHRRRWWQLNFDLVERWVASSGVACDGPPAELAGVVDLLGKRIPRLRAFSDGGSRAPIGARHLSLRVTSAELRNSIREKHIVPSLSIPRVTSPDCSVTFSMPHVTSTDLRNIIREKHFVPSLVRCHVSPQGNTLRSKHGEDAPGATCTVHVRVRHEPLGVLRRRGGEARLNRGSQVSRIALELRNSRVKDSKTQRLNQRARALQVQAATGSNHAHHATLRARAPRPWRGCER